MRLIKQGNEFVYKDDLPDGELEELDEILVKPEGTTLTF